MTYGHTHSLVIDRPSPGWKQQMELKPHATG